MVLLSFHQFPEGVRIGGRIDAAAALVGHEADDPHAVFERPQLLEFFPPFESLCANPQNRASDWA